MRSVLKKKQLKPYSVRLVAFLLLGSPHALFAEDRSNGYTIDQLFDMSPAELGRVNIVEVTSSSRIPELSTEAPASVSVIDNAEMKRLGYRTALDVLGDFRGLLSVVEGSVVGSVGARGRSGGGDWLGDWGGRILFQINGHRVNSMVTGNTPLLYSIVVDDIEKIEVSRGPGSVTYGSNAFFAVVNIITKKASSPAESSGPRGIGGSLSAAASTERRIAGHGALIYKGDEANGLHTRFSYSAIDHGGPKKTWYDRNFVSVVDGSQSVSGYDSLNSRIGFASVSWGPFSIDGMTSTATTYRGGADYGTLPGYPEKWNTAYHWLSAQYKQDNTFVDSIQIRAAYDSYSHRGTYWYDFGDEESGFLPSRNRDIFSGNTGSVDLLLREKINDITVVFGGEWRSNFNLLLRNENTDLNTVIFDKKRSENVMGLFGQVIYTPFKWLRVNSGIRFDRDDAFGSKVTPRVAIVFPFAQTTSLKCIYGQAYRSPSLFERYYNDGLISAKPSENLNPENVTTKEVTLEHVFHKRYFTSVSFFDSVVNQMINYQLDPKDNLLFFSNSGTGGTRGSEFEMRAQWPSGHLVDATVTHATGYEGPDNSRSLFQPRWWGGVRGVTPVPLLGADVSMRYRYTGTTLDRARDLVKQRQAVDLTLFSDKWLAGMDINLSILNVFSTNNSIPLGGDYRQSTWPIPGRILQGRITMKF